MGVEDMQEMHKDVLSLPARQIVPHILEVVADDPEVKQAQTLLTSWDYRLNVDSAAAAVYEIFCGKMLRNTFQNRLGETAFRTYSLVAGVPLPVMIDLLHNPVSEWFGPESGSAEEKRDAAIVRSLKEALADLTKLLGPEPSQWAWGKLHHARWSHRMASLGSNYAELFNFGPVPMPGDGYTVRNTGYTPGSASFQQMGAQSCRLIMDLGDLKKSLVGGVSGQSGQPYSKHFKDLVPEFQKGEYRKMLFDRKDIEQEAESTLILDTA